MKPYVSMKYLLWLLPPLLLLSLGCDRSEVQKADAGSEATAQAGLTEYPNPREPAELWPAALELRDKIRAGLEKVDPWKEDLAQLGKDIGALLEIVTEIDAHSKLHNDPKTLANVSRSVGDVRVAVFPVRNAIGTGRPEMFGDGARDLDQALRALEKRYPEGYFPVSVADRTDYALPRYR